MGERNSGGVYIVNLARNWGEYFAARAGADESVLGGEVLDTVGVILGEADNFGVSLGEVVEVNGEKVREIVVPYGSLAVEAGESSLILHRLESSDGPWDSIVKDGCGFRPATAGDFVQCIPGIFKSLVQAVSKQGAISR